MMTIKEFQEAKSTQPDFDKWFKEHAWHTVNIAGAIFPCVKLGRKKAGLSDGSVFTVNDSDALKSVGDHNEKRLLFTSSRFLHIYDRLSAVDRLSVEGFMEALDKKTTIEKKAKAEPERCSFCGKTVEDARKLIAAPGGIDNESHSRSNGVEKSQPNKHGLRNPLALFQLSILAGSYF